MTRPAAGDKYAKLAKKLNELIERPEHAGKHWDWGSIGILLGTTAGQAQGLIRWMRNNTDDLLWTVGTIKTDYQIIPTKARRDALDGLLNQAKHAYTRDLSAARANEVLSKIDPDPLSARISTREARFYRRRAEDLADHIDALHDEIEGTSSPSGGGGIKSAVA